MDPRLAAPGDTTGHNWGSSGSLESWSPGIHMRTSRTLGVLGTEPVYSLGKCWKGHQWRILGLTAGCRPLVLPVVLETSDGRDETTKRPL